MTNAGPILVAHGVWRTFDDGAKGVKDLELTVPAGTTFGIVGPSGSGKTTTVRMLLGSDAPDQGELTVFGRRPTEFTREDRARIGYLPQSPGLYPELSLRHNLNLVASLYNMPWRGRFWPGGRRRDTARRRITEVLEFVDLTDRQKTKLRDASGGEQRRLGLAAALVHEPQMLILDEPTAGIDPVLRRRIWDRLDELRDAGTTVLVTTQYVEEISNCDLVALLVDGRALVVDTPDKLRGLAFGDDPPDRDADVHTTFDDVFVELVTRHRDRTDDGPNGEADRA